MDYKDRFNKFKRRMEKAKLEQSSVEVFLLWMIWFFFETLPICFIVSVATYGREMTLLGNILTAGLTVALLCVARALTGFVPLYRESKKYELRDGYWVYWIK
ncbi:hypothetical protein IK110_03910 [Candidatus Saccharibacteria bacterium]|nr:hypothetical protein [Candidatus Saccharibacteria bacterium]